MPGRHFNIEDLGFSNKKTEISDDFPSARVARTRDEDPSCESTKCLDGSRSAEVQKVVEVPGAKSVQHVLMRSVLKVADSALPPGYEAESSLLCPAIEPAAAWQDLKATRALNVQAYEHHKAKSTAAS